MSDQGHDDPLRTLIEERNHLAYTLVYASEADHQDAWYLAIEDRMIVVQDEIDYRRCREFGHSESVVMV